MKIGFGVDVHPYKAGRALVLGGVKVPYKKGLQGHSDADVLVHAVMDALLGAAGLGDIGMHFPSHDSQYKNISSLILLEKVQKLLSKNKIRIGNIDATLLIEAPKIVSFIPQMQKNLSKMLGIKSDQINVKATRSEGLGFIGRVEGVLAYAICLVKKGR